VQLLRLMLVIGLCVVAQGGRMDGMILTATGLMPAEQFERGEKIFEALTKEAAELRESFADIAALLFQEARWQAFKLEGLHALATSLDAHAGGAATGGAPGIKQEFSARVADARRMIAAHLIFKAFADQEADVRMLMGLVAAQPVADLASHVDAKSFFDMTLKEAS
jgi:hypothetical protein